MGKREGEQEDLFVTHQQLRSQSHPFYRAVNRVLADQGFDRYVERLCAKF
jgi:ribosomal protein L31